jgi:TrmH family RNA methyltransferase
MITSLNNARVREIIQLEKKKKYRYETKTFVSEGIRMVLETPGSLLRELYISESFYRDPEKMEKVAEYFFNKPNLAPAVREDLSELESQDRVQMDSCSLFLVSDEVMRKMADTEHPQGILSVTAMPAYSMENLLSAEKNPLFLLPEDIQDPGNLGTMFRTAEGADATGLILGPGCTDPFQPKVVRSTMGSLFRMPFIQVREEDWYSLLSDLKKRGIRLYAAWLPGSVSYDEADYTGPTAFLIGNEGKGLKKETAEASDQRIRIPMGGKLESLNAAMSAGILLYEASRQRRQKS